MKKLIKEILIVILLLIAILLILGVVLYDYIPLNQVIPTVSEYKASEEVKEQLKEIATEDTSDIVLTYEVTDSDLGVYENTKNYDKGKANPFSSYSSTQTTTSSSNATQNNANGSSSTNTTEQSATSNTNSSNVNSSSQTTNTFYEETRNKII